MTQTKICAKLAGKAGSRKRKARAKTALEKQGGRRKLIMARAEPLEVPQRVGHGISRAVERFARREHLDHDLWYHDESIWRVRNKRDDFYREVQISAFFRGQDEHLFFIPQAYVFENGRMKAAKQRVVENLIKSLPLRELEASDDASIVKEVGGFLLVAWKHAELISESDLEPVNGGK
jgi:hypothetical protein